KERANTAIYLQSISLGETLQGVHTMIAVLDGEPAEAILEAVGSYHATLIAMCSHGDAGVQRWMRGSVWRKVARHRPVPVLVMRPTPEEEPAPFTGVSESIRVMVPLDGSELAAQ